MAVAATDLLVPLGFSRYEAQAYTALLRKSPMNGYELAKASGVPRPNIYEVLARLEERGAVMRVEDASGSQFVPIASDELVQRLRRSFERNLRAAETSLEAIRGESRWEAVMNTRGRDAVIALAQDVIRASRHELLLAVWPQEAELLEEDIEAVEAKGTKITTLCLAGCSQPCGHCHGEIFRHRVDPGRPTRWLVLAADKSEVLEVELRGDDAMAVRSRQRLLVELAVWYIRHTVALAALMKDVEATDRGRLSPETIKVLKTIGIGESGHQWFDELREILDPAGKGTSN